MPNIEQDKVKEHPILFKRQMVDAILSGNKTQTRRVMKPRPPVHIKNLRQYFGKPEEWIDADGSNFSTTCPYGVPGDMLWVRETWWYQPWLALPFSQPQPVQYEADGNVQCLEDWKRAPSIHMPRWASRILLEIVSVRIEHLQDISLSDALAEGIEYDVSLPGGDPISRFKFLWDSINAKRRFGWETNPYVWVIEFKLLGQGEQ